MATDPTKTIDYRQAGCEHMSFRHRGVEFCLVDNGLGYNVRRYYDVYYCTFCLTVVAIPRNIGDTGIFEHNQELARLTDNG